jgi:hypothetical protein
LAGIYKEMILFPYAKDVEYNEGELSFTLQFFNMDNETQINIKMDIEPDLREMMERLLVTN